MAMRRRHAGKRFAHHFVGRIDKFFHAILLLGC
jgi:hypothetical protein